MRGLWVDVFIAPVRPFLCTIVIVGTEGAIFSLKIWLKLLEACLTPILNISISASCWSSDNCDVMSGCRNPWCSVEPILLLYALQIQIVQAAGRLMSP
jgi:hypothetical protein